MININELIKDAMKNRDQVKLGTFKLIKTRFQEAQHKPGRNPMEDLTETEQVKVLIKMADERLKSIEAYKEAGRQDLVEKEQAELEILKPFLPKEVSEEEVSGWLGEYLKSYTPVKDSLGMADMKFLMSALKAQFPSFPGDKLSGIVRSKLT